MRIDVFNKISLINSEQWNALVQDNNPFLRHEFLNALETHGCVGEQFGWLPRHIAVYQDNELVAAMPVYEKYNSYGEFVFDNALVQAWQQHGLRYFPKLVSAIPYTPAGGQRMLVKKGHEQQFYPILLHALKDIARQLDASGAHVLFPLTEEIDYLQQHGGVLRHDCQFHWHNQNYSDFDDFLARLSSRKRKNIVKERQRVAQAGVQFKCLDGYQASAEDWRTMTDFYQLTYEEKWGIATLNYAFFKEVAEKLPRQVFLVLAEQDNQCIAGALMYRSNKRLYGRFWGSNKTLKGLHFEACYYQGIEYCIKEGLQVFEPGAQGEHKIARGFVPTLTRSAHFMMQDHFSEAIKNFVAHEKDNVINYIQTMQDRIPYRKSQVASRKSQVASCKLQVVSRKS